MKNLTNEEVNLLRQNARSVVRELGLLNDAYFEIGVTLAERHLLIELTTCPHPTMGEIAERLLLDKSTVSRLIAKAEKKGYIKCLSDQKDKRKRFLQMTPLGKKTLTAFEPIAFNQTKEALLTLTDEEVELVLRGVALYAKGLQNARLQNKGPAATEKKPMETLSEIKSQLDQLGYTLKPYCAEDERPLYEIFKDVIDSGSLFPYNDNSVAEFRRRFTDSESHVYVCYSAKGELVGGFAVRANYPGNSNHIANALYMIKGTHRGQGIGTFIIKASLQIAKGLGFHAMQYNMVLSRNITAVKLYQKLGFNLICTLPHAIRNPDGSYQDGYILHQKLDTI